MVRDISGNICFFLDEESGVCMGSVEFHTMEDIDLYELKLSAENRKWCNTHGIKPDDFRYQEKLQYEYYLKHAQYYTLVQQRLVRNQMEITRREVEAFRLEAEKRARAEEEKRQQALLEEKRKKEEAVARERAVVSQYLHDNKDYESFAQMVVSDYNQGLITASDVREVLYDHLRFYPKGSFVWSSFIKNVFYALGQGDFDC